MVGAVGYDPPMRERIFLLPPERPSMCDGGHGAEGQSRGEKKLKTRAEMVTKFGTFFSSSSPLLFFLI
jgi:hypothetical protein